MDEPQLARIRLLSRRFVELRGLRVAFAGMIYTVVFGSYLVADEPTEAGILIAILMSVLLLLPVERWLSRHYDSIFGRQVPHPRDRRSLISFIVVFSTLNAALDPLPSSVVIVGGYSLWIAIRDWPLRRYYIGATAAVAIAGAAYVTGTTNPDVALAMSLLASGVAFVPIGFLDHHLLVTLVRESREASAAAAEVHSPHA